MAMGKIGFWIGMGALGLALANGGLPLQSPEHGAGIASEVPADHGVYFAPAMRFDADAGSLEVTFGIEAPAHLTLCAFDGQGKLLAVLLDGDQTAGFHHLSLFSNRLQGYSGRAVFQLRAGGTVLAESRPRAR